VAIRAQIEPALSLGDNTAMNAIEGRCSDGSKLYTLFSNGWGDWSDWVTCRDGYAICAFQLRIQSYQGADDDTALNGIRIGCCSLPRSIYDLLAH
jgi:hypothetical protein